jgi:hypothetical protein
MKRPPKFAEPDSAIIVRAALRIGPLTLDGQAWKFGRRRFRFSAVARVIANGEAVRFGDEVRAT